MPLTSEELAFQLKQKYPAYASVPNEELVAKAVAKFPELRSQVLDLGGPSATEATTAGLPAAADVGTPAQEPALPTNLDAIKARAEGEAGLSFASALKGAGKGALGTAAGVADIALPGQPASEALGGAIVPSSPEEQVGATAAEMASFFLPTGISKLAQIPGLARSPWLLKLVAAALEGGKSGGLTAAQGGSPLATGLMGGLGAAGGVLGTAAKGLEASANRNVARAVGADITQANQVLDVAPQALAEGFRGTRGTLKRLSEERLGDALAAKKVLEDVDTPVGLGGVVGELGRRGGERTLATPELNPALTPDVVEQLTGYLNSPQLSKETSLTLVKKVLESMGATMDDFNQALALAKAPKTGDPKMVAALRAEAKDVAALDELWKGEMPLREVVRYAKGKGEDVRRTRNAFSDIPGQELGAGTEAGKETAGLLKDAAHKISPELGTADQKYHVYRVLKDALDKTGLRDLTTRQRLSLAEYAVARMAVGGAIGGYSGTTDSVPLNVAGGALLGLGSRTALAQTTSATFKTALARAIKSGKYEQALNLLESLPALENERNLPRAPED